MKVVCDSCQAKYQVPDERVAGKKLKIRCKRCGATVLIHGEMVAAPEPGDAAAPVAGNVEWHTSVDGQNYGPFDQAQVLNFLATHEAGWEAYVWQEGFAEWIEASACNELVHAANLSVSIAPQATPAGEDEGPTRMFQGASTSAPPTAARQPSQVPSVQPASAASASENQVPGLAAATTPVGALRAASHAPRMQAAPTSAIGSVAPARGGSEPRVRSPSANRGRAAESGLSSSPRVSASQAMTGERHEDSVLFSTKNLQQVAHTSSSSSISPASQPGFAGGEGSGLIDIRALAALAQRSQASLAPGLAHAATGGPGAYSQGEDSRVQLLNHPTGAFNRIDSLAPITTARPSSNAVPLAIFGGFAMVAAAAFAAIVLTHKPAPAAAPVLAAPAAIAAAAQPLAEPSTPQPTAAPKPAEAVPAVAAVQPTPAPSVAEPTPIKAALETADAKGPAKRHVRGARSASEDKKSVTPEEKSKDKEKDKATPPALDDVMLADKSSGKRSKSAVDDAAPAESKKAEPSAKAGSPDVDDLLGAKPAKQPAKDRSIDDLLDGAVDKKAKAAAAAAVAPAENLPESPSRDEVRDAMRGVEESVKACAEGQDGLGTAEVQIQVASTGRVMSATVSGVQGPAGSCIARAVRSAKFPRFSKPTFAVKYPYRLK